MLHFQHVIPVPLERVGLSVSTEVQPYCCCGKVKPWLVLVGTWTHSARYNSHGMATVKPSIGCSLFNEVSSGWVYPGKTMLGAILWSYTVKRRETYLTSLY